MWWWIMLLMAFAGTALFVRCGLKSKRIDPNIDSAHDQAKGEFFEMLKRYDEGCKDIRISFPTRK